MGNLWLMVNKEWRVNVGDDIDTQDDLVYNGYRKQGPGKVEATGLISITSTIMYPLVSLS